jgi:hypothetical protein
MPTYMYQVGDTRETIEVEQRITDTPFTHKGPQGLVRLPEFAGQPCLGNSGDGSGEGASEVIMPVRRLIAGSTRFLLLGGGWAESGYSK